MCIHIYKQRSMYIRPAKSALQQLGRGEASGSARLRLMLPPVVVVYATLPELHTRASARREGNRTL